MNIESIFIPIGSDCGIANALNKHNLRIFSLPFDWVVTYNGVTDIIINKFDNYLFPDKQFNISCHTKFVHNMFPNDYEKMNRRINRFMELLKNEEKQLIFIRKGHMVHHHEEAKKFNCILKNDLQDCLELQEHLINTYPKLKFKIIVLLLCENCFQYNKMYDVSSNKFEIHNIAKKTATIKEKADIWNTTIEQILRNNI